MLKARLFFIFCFTVSLLYTQQNKLSIETNSSAYSGWETYFSYNSIPSIAEGVNEIYFASYNSIFSYNIFNSEIEKFDTLNELSGDEISAFYHSENNNLIARSIRYKKMENLKPENHDKLLIDLKDSTGLDIESFEIKRMNLDTGSARIKIYSKD